jgi:hypothetical protein
MIDTVVKSKDPTLLRYPFRSRVFESGIAIWEGSRGVAVAVTLSPVTR